jgi:excisionase family DNA binding protein
MSIEIKPSFMSTHDAAKFLAVDPSTIRRLAKSGGLRSLQVGRVLRIDVASINGLETKPNN